MRVVTPFERTAKIGGPVEVIGKDFDLLAEGIRPAGMVRESADAISAVEQKPSGIFARVTQCTRDGDRLSHCCNLVISDSSVYKEISTQNFLPCFLSHLRSHAQEFPHRAGGQ